LKDFEGKVAKDSQVFCGVAAGVLAKADIQAPVQGVFDAPVTTRGPGEVSGICRKTGEVKALFLGGLPVDLTQAFDHAKALQSIPERAVLESANVVPGHSKAISTTNIWHARDQFAERVRAEHGRDAAVQADLAIARGVTCYAARLHLNKGRSIANPTRGAKSRLCPGFRGRHPVFRNSPGDGKDARSARYVRSNETMA